LPKWPWTKSKTKDGRVDQADHLGLARESLRELVHDTRLPAGVRESLVHDYEAVQSMLDKIEHGHLYLSVFGRVSTGKSSLLNALIGEERFSVSPIHGETRHSSMQAWDEVDTGGVFLIDTPGLDEAGGEDREALAKEVAGRSDLVVFVLDGDLTETELEALRAVLAQGRPVIVALNKSDLYTSSEVDALLSSIRAKTLGLIDPDHIIVAAAQPRAQVVVEVDTSGKETTMERKRDPDVAALRLKLWEILEAEGKTLAALNASLFAADLSDQVGRRILAARKEIGDRLVRTYCIGKGCVHRCRHGRAFVPGIRPAIESQGGGLDRQGNYCRVCGSDDDGMGIAPRFERTQGWHAGTVNDTDGGRAGSNRVLQHLPRW
jgi:small GTP-binding protein